MCQFSILALSIPNIAPGTGHDTLLAAPPAMGRHSHSFASLFHQSKVRLAHPIPFPLKPPPGTVLTEVALALVI